MLIEISDSTLSEDQEVKQRIYARAEIREYWIINLVDRQVEVCTDPTGSAGAPAYRSRRDYQIGDSVPLQVDADVLAPIRVADLLP